MCIRDRGHEACEGCAAMGVEMHADTATEAFGGAPYWATKRVRSVPQWGWNCMRTLPAWSTTGCPLH
eukprot:6916512-Pyramimonas_sp.AAC.1